MSLTSSVSAVTVRTSPVSSPSHTSAGSPAVPVRTRALPPAQPGGSSSGAFTQIPAHVQPPQSLKSLHFSSAKRSPAVSSGTVGTTRPTPTGILPDSSSWKASSKLQALIERGTGGPEPEASHSQRKKLSKEIPGPSYPEKNISCLPVHITKSVVGAIESYHSIRTLSQSSSGQTTPTTPNNSWSGIQSYATGLSTEQSSVFSWRDDEFDRVNTQRVCQLFWDIDEMLYEGKVDARTRGLRAECGEWNQNSPHLRILGNQIAEPKDEGFRLFQRRASIPESALLHPCQDTMAENKESLKVRESGVSCLITVCMLLAFLEDVREPSPYAFLEEETYEAEGQIEEFFAYDLKEVEEDGWEFRKALKINSGVPPVSPHACIKDGVIGELFDEVWKDVVHFVMELIQKHWESDLTVIQKEEDKLRNVNMGKRSSLTFKISVFRTPVKAFSVSPSRGSETRSMHTCSTQAPRIPSALKRNLNGVMTIQAKPLQHRHPGLGEKTQCEHRDPAGTGQAAETGHAVPSPSRAPCVGSRGPAAQRRLPRPPPDSVGFRRSAVLKGTKLCALPEGLSLSPECARRNRKFPPIHSEVPEQSPSVPASRHLQRRGRDLSSRVSSAVQGDSGPRAPRGQALPLEPLSRPRTSYTFRSDASFKRLFTPVDFVCQTRIGRGPFAGNSYKPRAFSRKPATGRKKFQMGS
uniref:Family with sequence similarity 149 member A n=1 Tax=Lepisosteus oculatus TaxID=7918 RepID=W5N8U1_LEPOC